MSKRKTATWFKRGRLWVVHPPYWPKQTELSFTEQDDMIEWARGMGYMLKDIGVRTGGRTYGASYSANA